MLDGRVLEASQVEYEPFGKTPLKREAEAQEETEAGRVKEPAEKPAEQMETETEERLR